MPLVDVTLRPGYRIGMPMPDKPDHIVAEDITHVLIKCLLAPALPALLVEYAAELGLDPATPPQGVQVMQHDYGKDDVNVADIWIKLQFSESRPDQDVRFKIRDRIYEILIDWFHDQGFKPHNLVIDLFWGPTNGKGTVDGVEIVW